MLKKLILKIIVAIVGLFLAVKFVAGVDFSGSAETFLLCGSILGLINFFLKPILKKITLPLRIITLGLSNFIINIAIIWFVDYLFLTLTISGLIPLFITSLIISILSQLAP